MTSFFKINHLFFSIKQNKQNTFLNKFKVISFLKKEIKLSFLNNKNIFYNFSYKKLSFFDFFKKYFYYLKWINQFKLFTLKKFIKKKKILLLKNNKKLNNISSFFSLKADRMPSFNRYFKASEKKSFYYEIYPYHSFDTFTSLKGNYLSFYKFNYFDNSFLDYNTMKYMYYQDDNNNSHLYRFHRKRYPYIDYKKYSSKNKKYSHDGTDFTAPIYNYTHRFFRQFNTLKSLTFNNLINFNRFNSILKIISNKKDLYSICSYYQVFEELNLKSNYTTLKKKNCYLYRRAFFYYEPEDKNEYYHYQKTSYYSKNLFYNFKRSWNTKDSKYNYFKSRFRYEHLFLPIDNFGLSEPQFDIPIKDEFKKIFYNLRPYNSNKTPLLLVFFSYFKKVLYLISFFCSFLYNIKNSCYKYINKKKKFFYFLIFIFKFFEFFFFFIFKKKLFFKSIYKTSLLSISLKKDNSYYDKNNNIQHFSNFKCLTYFLYLKINSNTFQGLILDNFKCFFKEKSLISSFYSTFNTFYYNSLSLVNSFSYFLESHYPTLKKKKNFEYMFRSLLPFLSILKKWIHIKPHLSYNYDISFDAEKVSLTKLFFAPALRINHNSFFFFKRFINRTLNTEFVYLKYKDYYYIKIKKHISLYNSLNNSLSIRNYNRFYNHSNYFLYLTFFNSYCRRHLIHKFKLEVNSYVFKYNLYYFSVILNKPKLSRKILQLKNRYSYIPKSINLLNINNENSKVSLPINRNKRYIAKFEPIDEDTPSREYIKRYPYSYLASNKKGYNLHPYNGRDINIQRFPYQFLRYRAKEYTKSRIESTAVPKTNKTKPIIFKKSQVITKTARATHYLDIKNIKDSFNKFNEFNIRKKFKHIYIYFFFKWFKQKIFLHIFSNLFNLFFSIKKERILLKKKLTFFLNVETVGTISYKNTLRNIFFTLSNFEGKPLYNVSCGILGYFGYKKGRFSTLRHITLYFFYHIEKILATHGIHRIRFLITGYVVNLWNIVHCLFTRLRLYDEYTSYFLTYLIFLKKYLIFIKKKIKQKKHLSLISFNNYFSIINSGKHLLYYFNNRRQQSSFRYLNFKILFIQIKSKNSFIY